MERLHQMHAVPDVLPEIHPSIDLHVIARTRPTVFIESRKVQEHVIPGTFLRPKQVMLFLARVAYADCASFKDTGSAEVTRQRLPYRCEALYYASGRFRSAI